MKSISRIVNVLRRSYWSWILYGSLFTSAFSVYIRRSVDLHSRILGFHRCSILQNLPVCGLSLSIYGLTFSSLDKVVGGLEGNTSFIMFRFFESYFHFSRRSFKFISIKWFSKIFKYFSLKEKMRALVRTPEVKFLRLVRKEGKKWFFLGLNNKILIYCINSK